MPRGDGTGPGGQGPGTGKGMGQCGRGGGRRSGGWLTAAGAAATLIAFIADRISSGKTGKRKAG